MRPVQLGNPAGNSPEERWRFTLAALAEIERASRDSDVGTIADAYTVTNFAPTRTLDPSTATLSDLANVFATFLDDLKRRGPKR